MFILSKGPTTIIYFGGQLVHVSARLVSRQEECPLGRGWNRHGPTGLLDRVVAAGRPAALPAASVAALACIRDLEKHLIPGLREVFCAAGGKSLSSGASMCSNPEIAPWSEPMWLRVYLYPSR